MRIAITRPLFDWQSLEDSPSLASLREILASIPDAKLLDGLRQHRGRGRDDYPVTVLWGVVLLTVLLRHKDFAIELSQDRDHRHLPKRGGFLKLWIANLAGQTLLQGSIWLQVGFMVQFGRANSCGGAM